MKKLLTVFTLLCCLSNIKAQFVTIPDANFVSWLQTNVPSAMNGNQMDTTSLAVNTRTIVDISALNISNIQGIQYFRALKKINCSHNNFTSIPVLTSPLEYLNCSFCPINNLSSLPSTLIYLDCTIVPISNLPSLPNSLETLICGRTQLTTLPTLPNSLKILDCNVGYFDTHLTALPNLPPQLDSLLIDGHLLTSIPTLPASLKKLSCYWNSLTTLPTLPNNLLYLNCSRNPIQTLPTLSPTLLKLICAQNALTSGLPNLPSTLTELNCENNSMPSLPSLPNSLINLSCGSCQLNSLPPLPQSLVYLDCQVNNISALPSLPNSLQILHCPQNALTSLPILPNSLFRLSCPSNNIDSLPVLPNSLIMLDVSNNNILRIDSLPDFLNLLDCSANLIDTLPYLPSSLGTLLVASNNITHIDFLPNNVYNFNCAYNQLTALPNLPPFLESFGCDHNNITCLPSLPSRITGLSILNNPFTCLPNYTPYMNAATLAYPLCSTSNTLTNPNNCSVFQGLEGNTYNDADNNCVRTYDQYVKNIQLKLYDNNNVYLGSTNSFGTGIYNFALFSGMYKVVVDTLNRPYSIICTSPGIDSSAILTPTVTNLKNINFPINCKPGFDIGLQSIVTNGLVFPGQTHTLTIMAGDMYRWYNMNCTFGISGTLSFTVNGPVSYIAPSIGALTPTVIGNVFTYNISDFGTISNHSAFQLLFKTDTTAQAGNSICITANITPTIGDNNITNNTYQDCYSVINSYDPNIKEVYPINVSPGFNDWLTYTIHFQNTGNAPAINIRLNDTLDNMLDLETFQVINYSHYNQTNLKGNVLNVGFPNIQLSDSSSNPIGSIGFIEYRIKPKANWVAPYQIKNTAYIYFDYNSPIVTNTTYNSIITDVGIIEFYENPVSIYPNPTNGTFNVKIKTKENHCIQLFDITGNLVLTQTLENGNGDIDASHLASGIYNIQIKGDTAVTNKKLVIVK